MRENEELRQEVKALRNEIVELKEILADIQKTVKSNLMHTQGLYGAIDTIKKK